MTKNLVIVESPAKAKTIEKFLGKDFSVKSSYGHIRDLPSKGMSIDIENKFTPDYQVSPDKKKIVAELRKATKNAEQVWLASDEDREGEAIAWHLIETLKLKPEDTKRIVFHEITKPAIEKAVAEPRTIDKQLVDAQQARRILDRLVGYELSPVLWKKVRRGLSAGRVQSVAVRLIVEREREIEKFEGSSSYKVKLELETDKGDVLSAELGKKLEGIDEARDLLNKLIEAAFNIQTIEKKPSKKSPSPPFTTSTLQQNASRRIGYSVKQTMNLAQRLYEAGHITYMRTDSLNLSQTAISSAESYIKNTFGDEYSNPTRFKTKSAGAQEAHEAIRPTNMSISEAGADEQQKKLYRLIWQRAVASQMSAARLEKTTISIGHDKGDEVFRSEGEIIDFEGFLKVSGKTDEVILPSVNEGEKLILKAAEAREVFARPPARYTEASLVKQLEEMGIGRPSTYAPTISTIQDRGYVQKGTSEGEERSIRLLKLEAGQLNELKETEKTGADKNKLLPTDVAGVVTDFLVKHFNNVVDYDFTRDVEAKFDDIADGNQAWQEMIANFYEPFHKSIEASESVSRTEVSQARELGVDPKSGKKVYARFGRYGPMIQIGESGDDEEKPQFAPMPAGHKVETVTFDEAMEMFKLPRMLGKTDDGKDIEANIGRFGPYVKFEKTFVSTKGEDPFTITLEKAKEFIATKVEADKNKYIQEFAGGINVLNGRYGPYISDGKKNARIPKGKDPKKITLDEAKELLAKAKKRK